MIETTLERPHDGAPSLMVRASSAELVDVPEPVCTVVSPSGKKARRAWSGPKTLGPAGLCGWIASYPDDFEGATEITDGTYTVSWGLGEPVKVKLPEIAPPPPAFESEDEARAVLDRAERDIAQILDDIEHVDAKAAEHGPLVSRAREIVAAAHKALEEDYSQAEIEAAGEALSSPRAGGSPATDALRKLSNATESVEIHKDLERGAKRAADAFRRSVQPQLAAARATAKRARDFLDNA